MSQPTQPLFPFLLHGGDYNPDQWRHVPGTVDEDFRLFREAGINSLTLGVFAWSALEPEDGRYEWGWLDDAMDRAAAAGMRVVLATPTGSKPNWLAEKYPEVRRMRPLHWLAPPVREEQGSRHNHCLSSPVHRAKVCALDRRLAERYAKHPALAAWHVGNESLGDCHCPYCRAAFREWLRARHGSLDALNAAWWGDFWSHRYTDWGQIGRIDSSHPQMVLDWKRFTSDRTIGFFRMEADILRAAAPGVPVTTNRMGVLPTWNTVDEFRFAEAMDVVSIDCYPRYHDRPDGDADQVARTALNQDLTRCGLQKPFLLMESVPGPVNHHPVNRLLRPGVHRAKSLQALAHGADTVQYFQMRKGRGGAEMHHGALIDHCGAESARMRMFGEVKALAADLAALSDLRGAGTPARAAIVWDWENQWALDAIGGPAAAARDVVSVAQAHHSALRRHGLDVDVVPPWADLSSYRLVALPALNLLHDGLADRLRAFVEGGGTLVATAMTGWLDARGLAFPGGFPGGGLRALFGVWEEECDSLYDDEGNALLFSADAALFAGLRAPVRHVAARLRPEAGAEVLAVWERDFYAGTPAATLRRAGAGRAVYLGGFIEPDALAAIYARLADEVGVPRLVASEVPPHVDVASRVAATGEEFLFVVNPGSLSCELDLGPRPRRDAFTGAPAPRVLAIGPHSSFVFRSQETKA